MLNDPTRTEKPNLVVYGHVGFDINITPKEQSSSFGGSAYYAALAASLVQNQYVGVVSVVGDDLSSHDLFKKPNILTEGIALQPGYSAIFTQHYNEQYEVVEFNKALNVCEYLHPDLIPEHFIGANTFFIATAPPYQQKLVLDWLIDKGYGGFIAIDTILAYVHDFRALIQQYRDSVDILFLNREEYNQVNWLPPQQMSIVLKKGPQGATFRDQDSSIDEPAPYVPHVRSTTGAGDILAGVFLACIAAGLPKRTALQKGIQIASHSVTETSIEHINTFSIHV